MNLFQLHGKHAYILERKKINCMVICHAIIINIIIINLNILDLYLNILDIDVFSRAGNQHQVNIYYHYKKR